MQISKTQSILITGATGLVGSHLAEQAVERGLRVKALCRAGSQSGFLQDLGVEIIQGHLNDTDSLHAACRDAHVIMHCAAKVGDWGPTREYRRVNVEGTRNLIDAAIDAQTVRRWVQISSMGVYPARDHFGTDESTAPSTRGIDGYTLTKVESEQLVQDACSQRALPAVILRPGFIYGPRDRTIIPRLLERLRSNRFAFLGKPDKVMNNTFVGNLCVAAWLAVENDDAIGEIYNIRDPRPVTRTEFIRTICEESGFKMPDRVVPLHMAGFLSSIMELSSKLLRRKSAPLVNSARIKFLGLNLDFDISHANDHLGYLPLIDFRDAMIETVRSFQSDTQAAP